MPAPNVLLLLSDQHAFRYLSHLTPEQGGEPVRTPTLDLLAQTSAYFQNAYCQVPVCTASRMCLLTGRDQENCSAWQNGAVLPPSVPTMPAHLAQAAGYETCLVGKMHFGGSLQFNGFRHRPYGDIAGDLWMCSHQADPIPGAPQADDPSYRGVTTIPESMLQEQVVVRESLAFLREHRHRASSQPWFLCASFSRPHAPFTAPARHVDRYWPDRVTPPRVGRSGDTVDHPLTAAFRATHGFDQTTREQILRSRAAYFACVDYLDEVLGDFLAVLEHAGFLDNTIVIYTSDHGEMCGEHGLWTKTLWHEASVRVPLMVQLPEHRQGVLAPQSVQTPVSLGDVFPTLCDLVGIEQPADLDGADLSDAIRRAMEPVDHQVIAQYLIPQVADGTQWRMVRQGRYKYVAFQNAPELLFDLDRDPDEQVNLASDSAYDEVLRALRAQVPEDLFAAAEAKREADEQLHQTYGSRVHAQTSNQLVLPDGRIVEADTALYQPVVLTERPQEAFDDWPDPLQPS